MVSKDSSAELCEEYIVKELQLSVVTRNNNNLHISSRFIQSKGRNIFEKTRQGNMQAPSFLLLPQITLNHIILTKCYMWYILQQCN